MLIMSLEHFGSACVHVLPGAESMPDHPINGAVIQSLLTHGEVLDCMDQVILDDVTSRLGNSIAAILALSRA